MKSLAVFLFALCLLNTLPLQAKTAPPPQVRTTFSFTPLPAWPVPLVPVQINGQTSATFALDTGTNFSAVTDTLAAKLGLVPKPYFQDGQPYQVLGKPADAVTLHTLQAGLFVFRQERVLVLPASGLSALLQQPIDGILGMDLLRHFAVEVDFPTRRITLLSPGGLSPSARQDAGFGEAVAVPLTLQSRTRLYLASGQLRNGENTGQENMLVDTGSGATAISSTLAGQLALVPVQSGGSTAMLSGTFPIDTARVPALDLGGLTVSNVPVVYPTQSGEKYGPLLGVDVLSQYRVLLDFPDKTMYLQAAPPPPITAAGPAPK